MTQVEIHDAGELLGVVEIPGRLLEILAGFVSQRHVTPLKPIPLRHAGRVLGEVRLLPVFAGLAPAPRAWRAVPADTEIARLLRLAFRDGPLSAAERRPAERAWRAAFAHLV